MGVHGRIFLIMSQMYFCKYSADARYGMTSSKMQREMLLIEHYHHWNPINLDLTS
jgi:hypothetical protein